MKITMISEYGNEIKVVTDYATKERLEDQGWKVLEEPQPEAAVLTPKAVEAPANETEKPKVTRTRKAPKNGKQ